MPFGIRPSNVRVCHFTTRAQGEAKVAAAEAARKGKKFRLMGSIPCEIFAGSYGGENLMAYAVIQTGGKQYRVAEGDLIEVEKLDVEAGTQAKFEEVLLVSNGGGVSIGAPLVAGRVSHCRGCRTDQSSQSHRFQIQAPERLSPHGGPSPAAHSAEDKGNHRVIPAYGSQERSR